VSNLAGVAQLVEQLICNQQVAGSSPITSSKFHIPAMDEYPSGQRGQAVNLLAVVFEGSNPSSSTSVLVEAAVGASRVSGCRFSVFFWGTLAIRPKCAEVAQLVEH
jgi:hypothetical protein